MRPGTARIIARANRGRWVNGKAITRADLIHGDLTSMLDSESSRAETGLSAPIARSRSESAGHPGTGGNGIALPPGLPATIRASIVATLTGIPRHGGANASRRSQTWGRLRDARADRMTRPNLHLLSAGMIREEIRQLLDDLPGVSGAWRDRSKRAPRARFEHSRRGWRSRPTGWRSRPPASTGRCAAWGSGQRPAAAHARGPDRSGVRGGVLARRALATAGADRTVRLWEPAGRAGEALVGRLALAVEVRPLAWACRG